MLDYKSNLIISSSLLYFNMPTKKQLSRIWETQFEFFGGFGQPKATYIGAGEGTSEGHGLTTERHVETPLTPQHIYSPFDGAEIGDLVYNPDSDDLKVVINQD